MAKIFSGIIYLNDDVKKVIKTSKNGNKYISISVIEKKEVDQYGNSHFITVFIDKDNKPIVGNLKPLEFKEEEKQEEKKEESKQESTSPAPTPQNDDDDLPF
jgi:hypothetical protein